MGATLTSVAVLLVNLLDSRDLFVQEEPCACASDVVKKGEKKNGENTKVKHSRHRKNHGSNAGLLSLPTRYSGGFYMQRRGKTINMEKKTNASFKDAKAVHLYTLSLFLTHGEYFFSSTCMYKVTTRGVV